MSRGLVCLLDHREVHCHGIVTWTGIDFVLEPHTGIDGFQTTGEEGIDVDQYVFIARVIFNLPEVTTVKYVARQRASVEIVVHFITQILIACSRRSFPFGTTSKRTS